jgi:peptide/nickel transport system permease protein
MAKLCLARVVRNLEVPLLLRYILPNVAAPIIIITSLNLGAEVTYERASAPWMVTFPGIALSLAVFSINVLGDGLRDAFDPRLRGR